MSSPLFLLLVGLVVGAVAGVLAAWAAGRGAAARAAELRVQQARLEVELAATEMRGRESRAEVVQANERHQAQVELVRELGEQLAQARADLAASRAELTAERSAGGEKLALLAGARAELANQFKTLAAEIFEEKSKRFGEHNHIQMDSLLGPLRERLGEFQQRVEGLKEDGIAGRSELKTQIEGLRSMNERLSLEASNLASALKGSSKVQGDWGEMLLEQMLEDAGLRKGHEYLVQESYTREDATRARPDVIVRLPEGRHLVIDAKVSLTDYNAYCACSDERSRAVSLERHVGSMRQHVRGLSKREYQTIYELASIDFVVLFVPIEPAYLLALSRDGSLWHEAWKKDVLLVSPGSLYPVIRTVAHLWRQDRQERSVQELVRRGGLLYEKLVLFAQDLVKVGAGLEGARKSYEEAVSKFSTGKGNAIRQAEMLRDGGIRTSKQMPKELVVAWQEDLELTLDDDVGTVDESITEN